MKIFNLLTACLLVQSAASAQDFGAMRKAGEAAVRQRMIDPASAQFEWPYGFVLSEYKPFLQKRVSGWITCGYVNAKNRMGGYTGRANFIVVMSEYATANFVEIGSGRDFDLVAASCQKSAASLPAPQAGMLQDVSTNPSQVGSIADEIAKLATLKEKGLITSEEFETQKTRLLAK